MKLDLLTNATVVDDAIRFVSHISKERIKSSTEEEKEESIDNSNEKESREPDYDEDEDQLEEKQEEDASELTINQVF